MNKKLLIGLLVASIAFGILVHFYNKARFNAKTRAPEGFASQQEQLQKSETEIAAHVDEQQLRAVQTEQQITEQKQAELQDLTSKIQQNGKEGFLYYKRALLYYSLQQYAQAIDDLTQAISLTPEPANAYYLRGMNYAARLEYKNAIADYTMALKTKPKEPILYNSRGLAFVEDGQMQAALADYQYAIQLQPEYEQAHYNLGALYERQKQLPEAKAQYDLAIKYFGAQPAPVATPVTTNTTTENPSEPSIEGSIKLEDTATPQPVESTPEQADQSQLLDAYYRRAIVNLEMGDYDAGLADVSFVIEKDPKSIKAFKLRAAIYGKLGNAAASTKDTSTAQDLSIGNMMQN